ncbi:MAG: indole-3-glycerol phosphate synthase TrpC [Deltaproteobacteria bacterium]|nr:indole-3-glycerol phosphate synthase TrpC [Deltaproteobacteria bacterium]
MILDRIVKSKRREVDHLKESTSLEALKKAVRGLPSPRDFRKAISGRDCSIIAEVKKSSPSRGRIREDFDPLKIASIYEANGAAAISVLTDEEFFEGKNAYLSEIKETVSLPLLRKEFIIDPYQIYETRIIGGDAVLLIASLLEEKTLRQFIDLAESLGLSALVEVHSREEMDKAIAAGAVIIGINNRNLKTFSTDLTTSMELAPYVPGDRIVISESGIETREDIETLMKKGIHTFLIGEALMKVPDIGKELRGFLV